MVRLISLYECSFHVWGNSIGFILSYKLNQEPWGNILKVFEPALTFNISSVLLKSLLWLISLFLGPPLLLPSLRLFIPPLRLVSAAMWQVVQRGDVQDYGMLEEFVTTVTDIVPELLSCSQRAQLILGLRARVRDWVQNGENKHATRSCEVSLW